MQIQDLAPRDIDSKRLMEIISMSGRAKSNSFVYGLDQFPNGERKLAAAPFGLPSQLSSTYKDNSTIKNNDVATGFGANFNIQSLAAISAEVLEQKFFLTDITPFLPINPGQNPFSPRRFTIKSFKGDVNPESGLISTNNKGQYNRLDVGVDATYIDRQFWAKEIGWNMLELQQSALLGSYSLMRELLQWLAQDFDLFQQKIAFYGFSNRAGTGLLTGDHIDTATNNTAVNVNTSLITTPIKLMTGTQLNTLVAGMISAYQANNSIFQMPDTFIIPQSDYTGLSTMIAPSFGVASGSPLELLRKMFVEQTGNANFKILPSPYAQKSFAAAAMYKTSAGAAPIAYDRYVLYQNNQMSLELDLPVPFTLLGTGTMNQFDYVQLGYAQMGQVFNKRTQNMLYFDNTNS